MKTALAIVVAVLIAVPASVAVAQYTPRDRQPDQLEDFLRGIGQDNQNRPLECQVTRRLNRVGDIVRLTMECHAVGGREGYGR